MKEMKEEKIKEFNEFVQYEWKKIEEISSKFLV